MSGEEAEAMFGADRQPMRRAVAFATTIKYSQRVVSLVGEISEFYRAHIPTIAASFNARPRHVDAKPTS